MCLPCTTVPSHWPYKNCLQIRCKHTYVQSRTRLGCVCRHFCHHVRSRHAPHLLYDVQYACGFNVITWRKIQTYATVPTRTSSFQCTVSSGVNGARQLMRGGAAAGGQVTERGSAAANSSHASCTCSALRDAPRRACRRAPRFVEGGGERRLPRRVFRYRGYVVGTERSRLLPTPAIPIASDFPSSVSA